MPYVPPKTGDTYSAVLLKPGTPVRPDWSRVTLGDSFSEGGAASLWNTDPVDPYTPLVCKLWNARALSLITRDKAEAGRMVPLVFHRDELYKNLRFVAWPRRVIFTRPDLTDVLNDLRGFTMLRLTDVDTLQSILQASRKGTPLSPDTAEHLAKALTDCVERLHAHPWHFRFGDLTPNNIMVTRNAPNMHFVDSDSFQYTYTHPITGDVHQYLVHGLTEGYKSKEGIAAEHARQANGCLPPLSQRHDLTVMAILLFQICVAQFGIGGRNPFDEHGRSEDANIADGRFPFDVKDPDIPDNVREAYQKVPPDIRAAFTRTFTHDQPLAPVEWRRLILDKWRSLQRG